MNKNAKIIKGLVLEFSQRILPNLNLYNTCETNLKYPLIDPTSELSFSSVLAPSKCPISDIFKNGSRALEFHGSNFSTKPEPNPKIPNMGPKSNIRDPNPNSKTLNFIIKLKYFLVYLHSWFLVIATQMLKISQILFNQTIEESNFSSDMQIPYMHFVFRITYNHSCKYQM